MVREICRDIFFLHRKAEPATIADLPVAKDLQDTLKANREGCVGMAANMIGVNKAIIIVNMGIFDMVMMNPVIVKKSGAYQTEEGCLSLVGQRPCTRYERITVEYQDMAFRKVKRDFEGWTAEIIQHEVDHLQGIII